MSKSNITGAARGADEKARRMVVKHYADAHDDLDRYGIPRFHNGWQLTLPERIELLAEKGSVERIRDTPAVHVLRAP